MIICKVNFKGRVLAWVVIFYLTFQVVASALSL